MCILWTYARLCVIWLCLVDSVMYPMNLWEIMRDFVMSRCCFGYASLDLVMFRLSLLFWLCSYSWLCIVYYINDTILYKGYYLWLDLVLLIDTPWHRPLMYISGRWQPIRFPNTALFPLFSSFLLDFLFSFFKSTTFFVVSNMFL